MGIDPQIGVKFCNFRTQKAVFLDHLVLEQPANQVRTFLLSSPSKRKRKKYQLKWKTCLFESATMPMGPPEVNLPESGSLLTAYRHCPLLTIGHGHVPAFIPGRAGAGLPALPLVKRPLTCTCIRASASWRSTYRRWVLLTIGPN